jgi:lipopolysaccharide export system permease protein
MYYQTAYVPGGQPIGALERQFAKLLGLIKSLFTRFGDRRRRRARV